MKKILTALDRILFVHECLSGFLNVSACCPIQLRAMGVAYILTLPSNSVGGVFDPVWTSGAGW